MKIAIVGKMRAGKNVVADMLTANYGFKQIAFADGITEIIKRYFPETLEGSKPRKHYQHIGQQLRALNPDVWINYLDRTVNGLNDTDDYFFKTADPNVIVTDCRFVNEAEYLTANDYMVIKVVADDELRWKRLFESGETATPEQFNHDTERQVDLIRADFIINNNGTYEELEMQVESAYLFYKGFFEPDRKYRRTLEERGYENK